ncbi:MAG TPA: glycosyltransferase [Bryobacteraceae bacterium]|jgi:O-antigen biosynthesis protein|nr:glycosyltransferase [Bryobacteraceae bacterium]
MTGGGRLREIAFDLYERYVLLEHIGELFRPGESRYNVLDVGGHTAAFWPGFPSLAGCLIPGASVAVVDIVPSAGLQNYVQGSGVQLPFRDGAFDLVCSLDTIEHIPVECRPAFLSELLRVTRDGLYLAFPFDSASNRWAEAVVVEYANVILKDPIPALQEHCRFGLPDRDSVTLLLSRSSYPWIGFAQGNTDVWLLMMLTYHSLRRPGTDFVQELNRRFNQVYSAQDWAEPHYRAGYLLSKSRTIAELEAVRASFGSAGKKADLQSVLAFCQLFLSIAHNGRAVVDKDRHIRNIEQELVDAQEREDRHVRQVECELTESWAYRQKCGELAATLRILESGLLGTPQSLALEDTLAEWPQARLSRLLEAAGQARAGEIDNKLVQVSSQLDHMAARLDRMAAETAQDRMTARAAAAQAAQLDRMAAEAAQDRMAAQAGQLQTIRESIEGIQSSMEFQSRLDNRMRDLEIGLVTNKRAIQAIYDSRIWKALCTMGGMLQRLTGRGAVSRGGTWVPREAAAEPAAQSYRDTADSFQALVCDNPIDGSVIPVRNVVEISGWAVAESGIDRVLIQINDDPPLLASYGVPRPDVARSHPAVGAAGQSGFRFFWDPTGLPEGPCTVRVTAFTRGGRTQEAIRNVLIDWTTPPGYGLWIARNEPTVERLRQMRREAGNFAARPRISIAVPVYKTPIALLTRCIESVLEQTYPEWELCLADDGSHDADLAALLRQYAKGDARIRVAALERNLGISGATNAALRLCTGEYVAFLDHDDELAPFALSAVVEAINDDPDTEVFYSDEDKLDEKGRRYDAFFKPDWSPDLLLSLNYICHLVVMKRSLVERLGGLDESYSGAQDYEFVLRASERTQKIRRIPKVLYHWRAVAGSAAKASEEKPQASADGKRALAAYVERNMPGACVEETGICRYRVRYPIALEPRVSILIPTGGHKNVFRAVDEVLEETIHRNYEILLIDNSRTARVEEYAARLAGRKAPVRYFDWRGKPFNFSQMNNAAARTAASPYVLFLNDDTAVISAEWLTAMLEHAQRSEVGAVGAQLWYPNNLIQHAGVVMGMGGNCSHAFKGVPAELQHCYFGFPNLIRNCSAVTGACLLVAREKFFEAGAFDEVNLAVAFQDVDLCLKLLELGYRNVYTPYAKLYHYESATKTEKDKIPDPMEDAFMKRKWARYIADDPYYNPNLARQKEDFSLAID